MKEEYGEEKVDVGSTPEPTHEPPSQAIVEEAKPEEHHVEEKKTAEVPKKSEFKDIEKQFAQEHATTRRQLDEFSEGFGIQAPMEKLAQPINLPTKTSQDGTEPKLDLLDMEIQAELDVAKKGASVHEETEDKELEALKELEKQVKEDSKAERSGESPERGNVRNRIKELEKKIQEQQAAEIENKIRQEMRKKNIGQ
ncbi:MAG: hypothetical protein JSR46_04825 [Verrucomicrobia bacterium]|nr:hypothetical protein [Verrucomicrobiota bacterium]